jgi:hypothetical protein
MVGLAALPHRACQPSHRPVNLSAAKDLSWGQAQILCCAQVDRLNCPGCEVNALGLATALALILNIRYQSTSLPSKLQGCMVGNK